jgi:excisionase family DNA binding protein
MRLLKAERVAEMLDTSAERVYALVREGILPAVHLGRNVRVSEDALHEFIASGGKSLPGGWRREAVQTEPGAA